MLAKQQELYKIKQCWHFKSLGRDIFQDGIVKLYNFHKKRILSNYTPSFCAHSLSWDQWSMINLLLGEPLNF